MANIEILSSEIVNQIAAGEVVERPAHLVKELVENSLDAGADQILVEASEGGRNIRVIDNGSGILSDELEKALQRHATSKIKKTDDLWNLNTFGFRGEALASAAAVSNMTLKSFERQEKKASQIQSKFGVLSEVKPSSQSVGTEIKIEDLFENVPARLKFLKSETGELGQIKAVVKALALANPTVEFKLVCNGNLQLFYAKKSNHLERARDVLEKQNVFEAKGSYGSFKCHAVFSSPHEVAKTSKQIWIFAQNRWIQDRSIQAAVMDAFRSLLMHGEFPFAVVWIECDPSEIDVNIHPTKSQVKFQNSSNAFKVVQNTLRLALEKAPWIAERSGMVSHSKVESNVEFPGQVEAVLYSSAPVENLQFTDHSFNQTQYKHKSYNPSVSDLAELRIDNLNVGTPQTDRNSIEPMPATESTNRGFWSSLQIIGQAHLTYIVCQKEDRLVFVDQHAAHERVVYESLMKAWREKNFEVQNYLFPLAIDLTEEKVEALIGHQQSILDLGFEVEQLGPAAIGIRSAPAMIKDSGLPLVFDRMASELLQNGGSFAIEKKVSDIFATMACHSVVRAGQSLSFPEMAELLRSMDQFALSSFCPHGRPVSVEKSFVELEKLFGRIN